MNVGALQDRLPALGRELGLAAVGCVPLTPPEAREATAFRDGLAAGRHGRMGFLSRTAATRLDPRGNWPWARTAVVAALAYPREAPAYAAAPPGTLAAALSRHALGDDYHAVLAERLSALAPRLDAALPPPGLGRREILVDTAPLLERALAERAGLGRRGRNGCLYLPGAGSWVVLGELLVEAELGEAYAPAVAPRLLDKCAGCAACLAACPTGALGPAAAASADAPAPLDARRCRAYLTIEHRGELSAAERRDFGPLVYGCDACQAVCPVNQALAAAPARPSVDPRLELRSRYREVRLAELSGLGRAALRELFSGSGLARLGRSKLARNAAAVLSHLTDQAPSDLI